MWSYIILFSVVFNFVNGTLNYPSSYNSTYLSYNTSSGLPSYLETEISNFLVTGNFTTELQNNLDVLSDGFVLTENFVSCSLCQVSAFTIITYVSLGGSEKSLRTLALFICQLIGFDEDVCNGVLDLNLPLITYILMIYPKTKGKDICKIIAQSDCVAFINPTLWKVELYRSLKKPVTQSPSSNNQKPLIIVHLTDIHFDPLYKIGSNAKCSKPMCCREYNDSSTTVSPNSNKDVAGYWGAYSSCDVPIQTVKNCLNQIKSQFQNPDLIYYTGDVIAHNIWSTTYEQINSSMYLIFELIYDTFPNVPVIPVLGNHETQPLNQFSLDNSSKNPFSTTWLYQLAADVWKHWLGTESKNIVHNAGSYSLSPKKGLKVIAFNNNACYVLNWWLLGSTVDPNNQLQWLSNQLLNAEMNGQFVHIIYHIPPGESSCEIVWQRQFRLVIQRFSHIIKGQFSGHTHTDELRIFYDPYNIEIPIGVSFDGGSITPYANVNANYRIFQVQPKTYDLLDYDQWVFNLTEANLHGSNPPRWYKLYSFTKAYGVQNLNPSEVNNMVQNLARNDTLIQQYLRYLKKNSDFYREDDCNSNKCIEQSLCNIVTSVYDDSRNCDWIVDIRRRSKNTLFNKIN